MRTTVACLLAAGVAAAAAPAAVAPRVMLVDRSPVAVAGTGFAHAAAVKVTVAGGGTTLAKTVRTTRTGSFAARFGASTSVDPCVQVVIRVATRGTLVVKKIVPAGASGSCGAQPLDP